MMTIGSAQLLIKGPKIRFWVVCYYNSYQGWAGQGENENPRGGAKKRINRLIQKFDKSAYIVMEIFIVYYDVLINENIISSHF